MQGLVVLAVASCLAGCARDPGRDASRAPRPASTALSAASPLPSLPPLPPPRDPLGDVACRWRAQHLVAQGEEDPARDASFLRFTAGGPAFARFVSGDAAILEIPVALASAGGELEIRSAGVTVRGHLESAEMPLYPARVLTLGEVYVPTSRVSWRRASAPGRLTVAANDVAHLRATDGRASFEAEGSCDDVQLGPSGTLEPSAVERSLGAPGALTEQRPPPFHFLKAGITAVAATSDGSPVARIEATEPPDDTLLLHLRILETRGGKARIVLPGYGGVLVGWIDRERLRIDAHDFIDMSHDCTTLVAHMPTPGADDVVCSRDLPLVAEVRGERHLVGTVHAGARLHPGAARDGWSAVDFPLASLVATTGASFSVRSLELASCTRAP